MKDNHCDAFTVTLERDISSGLVKLKEFFTQHEAEFEGDEKSGVFGGRVPLAGYFEGSYVIVGKEVSITITQRPLFSCEHIEKIVREFLTRKE